MAQLWPRHSSRTALAWVWRWVCLRVRLSVELWVHLWSELAWVRPKVHQWDTSLLAFQQIDNRGNAIQ
eukprot:m.261293 g.261293  ORF g.261293 m.261293 type:complete len:68 (-) comp19694_c2_seq5:1565-1768(-)